MVDWLEWDDEVFTTARERGAPILLFVKASWCRWCRELEERVLSDERVTALVERHFLPVRVDKDRRPDVDARYTKGGWPTLAYLDDAGDLLAADNYLEVDELVARLELIAEYYATNREAIHARLGSQRATPVAEETTRRSLAALGEYRPELSLEIVESVAETVIKTADPVHGGWGSRHKFPHPEAIDFALVRWSQTGDNRLLDLVRRTLRRMQEGEIHDKVEGGFYRYATQPDWSVPHHEKMLDSNAQRLFAYLEAYQTTGEESFRRTAQGILHWLRTTLRDEETGAFWGSQDADAAYAHKTSIESRRAAGNPEIDRTVFANWNAMTVSALLKASSVLEDDRYRELALETLDFLLTEMYDHELGMHHYWDGHPHLLGLLGDQAYTLRALIDAVQFAGENRYLDVARELGAITIERYRSPSGAFFDTHYDPGATGELRRRNRSILENSVMAEALLRLAHFSCDKDFEDAGREALESFAVDYKRYGHFVAGYARAVDLLLHPPLHVTIVGSTHDPKTHALARAALRPYVASRVVQIVDPAVDGELLAKLGYEAHPDGPRAYVHQARGSFAETSDPARLPGLMTRAPGL